MKKWIKILIGIVVTPVLLIAVLLLTYVLINHQGVIEPFQVGNPKADNRILIASQGSEFKNTLLEQIIDMFDAQQHYLSVMDCTALGTENAEDWDVVIIIHTMQIHKMPKEAHKFLAEVDDLSRTVLISTSGGGDDRVLDFEVDAISAASRVGKIPEILDWVNDKVDNRLKEENLVMTN